MGDIDQILTPCPVIDLRQAEANLQKASAYARAHNLSLRPHIKTHKLPYFAKRQIELGAVGITCQKIGEAEVMADHGLTDILLPYNFIGRRNLKRLLALSRRAHISVTADSSEVIDGYADAFVDQGRPLEVLIECDTGGGRCGVQDARSAVALARRIDRSAGLRFGGLMTYPPRHRTHDVNEWLMRAKQAIEVAGLPVLRISNGGTPDFWRAHEVSAATEHRPGTYIYMDRMQTAFGAAEPDECAFTVLTTVVSRPVADRAVIDAGSKALTSDLCEAPGFGHIREYPDAVITALSEEHGIVDLSKCAARPRVGERVSIVPNHVCPVSNLFDEIHLAEGVRIVQTLPIAARGKVY